MTGTAAGDADAAAVSPEDARALVAARRAAGRTALDEREGKAVLAAFGIAVPRSVTAATPEAAAGRAATLRPPLVLKALSAEVLHKSDIGAVRLDLSAGEVAEAADAMTRGWSAVAPPLAGFLVEEMAPGGQEIVIGGFLDPQFGPMVMVGIGGVFVEILADTSFRVCPIGRADAAAMLGELRARALLEGARGRPAANREAIVDALVAVGGENGLLMTLADDLRELDVNPLIVSPEGAVAVDARLVLAPEAAETEPARRAMMPETFEPLFAPRTVAVAGVSASGRGPGNRFIANLRSLGFSGRIFPIHPSAEELDGLSVCRNLGDTPEPVDYAYVAVPSEAVPPLLESARGRVRFSQIMTSGFGEAEGSDEALLEAARTGGMRLIGPNSLGTYSPRGRISFAETRVEDAVPGPVAVISQSGGIGVDFVRTGQARGLRYSGVVTIGNSADIGANDLLEHFIADPATSVIGMYLEDIKDGRRFLKLLNEARGRKAVVLLKGGRSREGQKAVASHTGALAGDDRIWAALAAQTGAVLVDTIEELMDTLLMFQTTSPSFERPTRRIVLFGNGGGAGVVATDRFSHSNFELAELSSETRARLKALEMPPGASDANPIDLPANALNRSDGRIAGAILAALADGRGVDAIVVHLNMPVLISYRESRIVPNIVDCCLDLAAARTPDSPHLLMVLRSDGSEEVDGVRRTERRRAVAAGVPVFDNFSDSARALAALARFERQFGAGAPWAD